MQPASHRLRRGRRSIVGTTYHLRFSTLDREPYFWDLFAARAVMQTLEQEDASARTTTHCAVLMPDHLHWLVCLNVESLGQVVSTVKRFSCRRAGGQIAWQRGFFDRAMRSSPDTHATARYILNNPIRAGLVETLGGYPHWHVAWSVEEAAL